jgi:hypothetical protein
MRSYPGAPEIAYQASVLGSLGNAIYPRFSLAPFFGFWLRAGISNRIALAHFVVYLESNNDVST